MKNREEVMRRITKIPDLPPSCVELLKKIREEQSGIDDVVRIIELDPGLSTNLLRLANSASMGGSAKIESVRNAAVRLGKKNIMRMVLEVTISPLIGKEIKGYGLSAKEYWLHSIAVSIGSRESAQLLGVRPAPAAETAALLHDIGKVVLGTFLEQDAEQVIHSAVSNNIPFEVAEEEIIGISHPEAGAILLEEWNLPESLVSAARWHHDPDQADENNTVDMIHIADFLSISAGLGLGRDGLSYHISNRAFDKFGLTDSKSEQIISEIITGLDRIDSKLKDAGGGGE